MRESLVRWIGDADVLRHLDLFRLSQASTEAMEVRYRADDYFLALVGELFDRMRDGYADSGDWARLGNALAFFGERSTDHLHNVGVSPSDAAFFAAVAFYIGGYPASAYLVLRELSTVQDSATESQLACLDFLARSRTVRSQVVRKLIEALRSGHRELIEQAARDARDAAQAALVEGPNEWIPTRVLQQLLDRFIDTNIRAVLPDGYSHFWNDLVSSLLGRTPPIWEFFPSQTSAIRSGLLSSSESFSLQMPTGAGKTALCETLLYAHIRRYEGDTAVLLVPYRSLASELRSSLVRRLNAMGISTRCVYGGTVPTGDEVQGLDDTRAIIATPEALSGLLSAGGGFLRRISLVICDEGHILDSGERGVGLELLLARMRSRENAQVRFVFVSAIVPNIEEINAWLGGTPETVVSSDYRPALADFALLRASGSGVSSKVALDLHPHEAAPPRYTIERFLTFENFQFTNPATRRRNTYGFSRLKTRAVAAARKALPLGAAAVFAANKRGDQGAVGLASELLAQLDHELDLPTPIAFADVQKVALAAEYLEDEYGADWVGTKLLKSGAVIHHGDIPQETREVIEDLIRQEAIRFVICTNTLAEGVNLPIRTLVLYSVQRREKVGPPHDLLIRDIKNLVGRVGRAGVTTKGLVICVNEQQWPLVEQVARQALGEPVEGALRRLLEKLRRDLAIQNVVLLNSLLEQTPALQTLVDGIDATLIDLAAEEIGEAELARIAVHLADQTFAARQVDAASKLLLQSVFELRARRIAGISGAGRLTWVRETGARARMLDSVEFGLLPLRTGWDDVSDPLEPEFVATILTWAWGQRDLQDAVSVAYRIARADVNSIRASFFDAVRLWLSGSRFKEIAERGGQTMDDTLGVHAKVISFVLQTIVEQGIALLAKFVESQGRDVSPAVMQLPNRLRFGVPTAQAQVLAAAGVRHRRAAVELGDALTEAGIGADDLMTVFSSALHLLDASSESWTTRLGALVTAHTKDDIVRITDGSRSR